MKAKIYTNKLVNYQYDKKQIRSGHDEQGYIATSIFLTPIPPNGDELRVEVRDYLVTKNEDGEKIEVEIYRDLNYATRPITDINGLEDIRGAIAYELLTKQKLTPIRNTTADDWVSEVEFLETIFPEM